VTRTALLALALLVALFAGAIFAFREWSAPLQNAAATRAVAERPMAAPVPRERAPAGSTAPAGQGGSASQPSPPAAASREAAAAPAPPPASPAEQGPTFDIVRIGPDGSIVAAGRGKPGSSILLMAAGRELGRAPADGNGEWVLALPEIALPPGTHTLMLRQLEAGRLPIDSDRTVVIVMPERRQGGPAIAMAPPTGGPASPEKAASDAPASALVFSTPAQGAGTTTVMQSPIGPARAGDLTVATLDYDSSGIVAVSGTAAAGTVVRAYLDDALIGQATVGADGRWRILASEGVATGAHRLRVDRLDAQGRVAARLELPFVRQAPAAQMAEPGAPMLTIVRGDNLWNIARARYGDGFRYTVIFEANRSQIRDPNLIYPGQVFRMPGN